MEQDHGDQAQIILPNLMPLQKNQQHEMLLWHEKNQLMNQQMNVKMAIV